LILLLSACSAFSDEEWVAGTDAVYAGLAESGAIIYRIGGYTYAPVEVIARALGIEWAWDGDMAELSLDGDENEATRFFLGPDEGIDVLRGDGGVLLMHDNELYFWNDSPGSVTGSVITDNRGNTYTRYLALISRTDPTRLEIPLDEKYNLFTFSIAIPEAYTNDRDAFSLRIYGDGRLLYQTEATFGHRPAFVEIDVTDVSRLWISYTSINHGTIYGLILGNPTFIIEEGVDGR